MENQETEITHNQTTIFDIFIIFLSNKKKIFLITGLICLANVILYFFVFDLIFVSNATVKSTSKSLGLLGGLDANLPDIGALDDLGLGGGKSAKELAAYQEILYSRRCLEKLILKFGLMERDQNEFIEDAIKNFRAEQLKVEIDRVAGIMNVTVLDKDPYLAKEMVEFLLSELDAINIEMNVQNAKSNREFIEKRFYQAKQDLKASEDSLKSFQFIYGVAPDMQIKAAAQSVFSLEAELRAEEIKLDVIKKILSADQPEVKTQEAKVTSLRSKISEISTSTDLTKFLRLGNSPQIAMGYLRLQRDVEIQTKILTFILPLYEQAKIEEKRETPSIIILDKPYVASKKIKPKRLTMVVLLTFVGFIFTVMFFVLLSKIKIFRKQLNEKLIK